MPTELGNEAVEVCTMALDKFQTNADYEGMIQLQALTPMMLLNHSLTNHLSNS
jgi:hypothetical protein